MLRRVVRKAVRAVRRFNRAWIDALDPDHAPGASYAEAPPPPAPPPPRPAPEVWAEPTPNPDAMKFSASVPIAPRAALSFDSAEAAAAHPLGRAVFAVPGVRSLFAVNDFVTVTRLPGADWGELVPRLERAIAEALSEG